MSTHRYILRRLLAALPIFFGITAAVYLLSCLAPGNVVDILAGEGNMTHEAYAAAVAAYHLDKPILIRYLYWLGGLLQGDLGLSSYSSQPVAAMIAARIGPTLLLTGTSLAVAVLLAVPLGVLSARKPHSFWDGASTVFAFVGASAPNFFLGLVLIYVFAVRLRWLPSQGMFTTGAAHTLPDLLRHLLMPTIVLVVQLMGSYLKQTRGAVLETLGEDYVRTARAKGVREHAVVWRHALRNAWIPVVTTIGLNVPFLIGGAVVTEQVFGWPGLGSLMITAVSTRDYNLIMGITVLIAVAVLLVNILLDVVYAALDPRIRLS